jgi:hypothetical protein
MEERQQKKRANRSTVPQGNSSLRRAFCCLLIWIRAGPADSEGSGPADTGPVGTDLVVIVDTGPTGLRASDLAGPAESFPAGTGPADTGPADTGPADTDPAEIGPADTGRADTGPADIGPAEPGPADTVLVDIGPADTGLVDIARWSS